MTKRLGQLVAQRARAGHYCAVATMRVAFFGDQPVHERSSETEWFVVTLGADGPVVGCWSETDLANERHILDFYRVPGRDGVLATLAMNEEIRQRANRDARRLVSAVDPENAHQIEHEIRRGFVPIALLLIKEPEPI